MSESTLERRERQLRALIEAGKALSSEVTIDGVLDRIINLATELAGARYGALGVLNKDGKTLNAFLTVGVDAATYAAIGDPPKGKGILGVLIKDPKPLRLKRLQDHPRSAGFPPHHPAMSSFLGVPIITKDAVAGRIYLADKIGAEEFSAEDEELVVTLASQAAIAIQNAQLYEKVQRTVGELEVASHHKTAFLANMSHELRSPLNTIIGYTRLLLEDAKNLDEEQIEDLELIRGSGEHLLALITDLLDLQRIESGRTELDLGSCDIAALVRDIAASVRPAMNEGVELYADLTNLHDGVLVGDRTRLRQVLLNVVGNAAKFTRKGEVRIEVKDDRDDPARGICIDVSDTGPGIPEVDQQRIFESFYQSQAAMQRRPGPSEGAGLGLAIAQRLVELHQGSISLTSSASSGTVVAIRLPRAPQDSNSAPEVTARAVDRNFIEEK